MKKKWLLGILGTFCIATCALGLSACSGDDPGTTGLQYRRISGKDEYSVVGIGIASELNIVIPATYNGLPVTEIGYAAFQGCSYIESVAIPDSVKSIGNGAFSRCTSLTEIVIPDSVKNIGDKAFYGCNSLENITLPFVGASKTASSGYDQVVGYIFGYTIKSDMHSEVSGETYQYSKDSNFYYYYIPESLKSITILGGDIGESAFFNCDSLTSVTIPDVVTSIGSGAFFNCTSLTSTTIHESVTCIGDYAFCGCNSLTSIDIPDSVTSIGWYAFLDCSSLASVTIGDSVESIGAGAFSSCDSLTSVVFKDKTTWYYTENVNDWENKTGGIQIDVSSPLDDIAAFYGCWYKLD